MLSKYQYMLQMPASMAGGDSKLEQMVSMMMFSQAVETENPDAEKFSAYSLSTLPGKYKSEEIILYGVENNSKYINIKWKTSDSASDTDVKNVENIPEVYLSSGYAEKFSLKKGDTITLKEKYENKKYKFKVAGVYDYVGSLSIFMSIQELNKTFDMDKDSFSGYFSDSEITDIDEKYTLSDKLWNYLQNYAEKHRAKGNGFGFGLVDLDGISRTLSARYYKDGSEILIPQNGGKNPRRLSPRECARLMGYPDEYRLNQVSDVQAYRQCGNSVVVPLITAVSEQLIKTMLTS